ncbi:hypothetical protein CkaCkLH20_08721 [Colletotrichum karsti]|uniref:BTB domain-containing protein n=1 Tax=Colletotrichum karsti TaxID=1095194 RepID=A0A9P6HZ37_9PEZI|nr:uncharacterized protein CkaCkLH20_08721 [Colletotrichum karsti]KAF9873987.1 hypothetical protein CkaCkLH20_08721 [Colletotrichum karsti]
MGSNEWKLHEKVIRGRSDLVDLILDEQASVDNGIKVIPLKEHMFPAPALEATLKYFYAGDDVLEDTTEIVELLAIYEVSATLLVPPLEKKLASRIGEELGNILQDRVDMLDEFMMIADIIVNEEGAAWEGVHRELQTAIAPHLVMLLQQAEFSGFLKGRPEFCFATLSTAVKQIEHITNDSETKLAKAMENMKVAKTDDDTPTTMPKTPMTKHSTSTKQSQDIQTAAATINVKIESPDTTEVLPASPSLRTVDAGSTPFLGSRSRNAIDSKPFKFEFRSERALSPTPRAANRKKSLTVKFSPTVTDGKAASDDESLVSEGGNISVSDTSSQWESCDEGTLLDHSKAEQRGRNALVATTMAKRSAQTTTEIANKSRAMVSDDSAYSSPAYTAKATTRLEEEQSVGVEPLKKRTGSYHFSSKQLHHDQTSDYAPPAGRSGMKNPSSSIFQEPRVSTGVQESYTNTSTTASRPRTLPSAYAVPVQHPAPCPEPAEQRPILDRKTTRQVEKGRLHVETSDTFASSGRNHARSQLGSRTDEAPIACNPS